ncbi:hypothetical protein QUF64_12545 [Anaerolineales bacterium HSG6]|nr:hypothetical protein [Anaerolineales bacterium HSG6]
MKDKTHPTQAAIQHGRYQPADTHNRILQISSSSHIDVEFSYHCYPT